MDIASGTVGGGSLSTFQNPSPVKLDHVSFAKKAARRSSSTKHNDDLYYGCRRMTQQELVEYDKSIDNSMGFDINVPSGVAGFGVILPHQDLDQNPSLMHALKHCSTMAIAFFNYYNGTNFKFAKVVKANTQHYSFREYITFEAMNEEDQSLETFQAIVYTGVNKFQTDTEFVRIKPKS